MAANKHISMPMDKNNNPVPALTVKDGLAHEITVSGVAAENVTAFETNTEVISMFSTTDIFYKFGENDQVTATTNDHFFPKGVYYDMAIPAKVTHISVLRVTNDGKLYISEKQ